MPCYVTGSAEGDARLSAREAQQRATLAARVACEALSLLEQGSYVEVLSEEAQVWWAQHKLVDEQRRKSESAEAEKERLREAAISKLSDEERKALGL